MSQASNRNAAQTNLDIYRQAMNEKVLLREKGTQRNNSRNLDTEPEEAFPVSAQSSRSNEAPAPRNAPSFLLFAFCFAIASALFLFQHPGLGFVLCVLLSSAVIKGLLATKAGQVFRTATTEVEQAQKQKIPFTTQKDVGTSRNAVLASDAAPAPAPSHDLASVVLKKGPVTTVVFKKEPVKVQRTAPAPIYQSADLNVTPQAQYSTKALSTLEHVANALREEEALKRRCRSLEEELRASESRVFDLTNSEEELKQRYAALEEELKKGQDEHKKYQNILQEELETSQSQVRKLSKVCKDMQVVLEHLLQDGRILLGRDADEPVVNIRVDSTKDVVDLSKKESVRVQRSAAPPTTSPRTKSEDANDFDFLTLDRFLARTQLHKQQVDTRDGKKNTLSPRSPTQRQCDDSDRGRANQGVSTASGAVSKLVGGGQDKTASASPHVGKQLRKDDNFWVSPKNMVDSSSDTSDDDTVVNNPARKTAPSMLPSISSKESNGKIKKSSGSAALEAAAEEETKKKVEDELPLMSAQDDATQVFVKRSDEATRATSSLVKGKPEFVEEPTKSSAQATPKPEIPSKDRLSKEGSVKFVEKPTKSPARATPKPEMPSNDSLSMQQGPPVATRSLPSGKPDFVEKPTKSPAQATPKPETPSNDSLSKEGSGKSVEKSTKSPAQEAPKADDSQAVTITVMPTRVSPPVLPPVSPPVNNASSKLTASRRLEQLLSDSGRRTPSPAASFSSPQGKESPPSRGR